MSWWRFEGFSDLCRNHFQRACLPHAPQTTAKVHTGGCSSSASSAGSVDYTGWKRCCSSCRHIWVTDDEQEMTVSPSEGSSRQLLRKTYTKGQTAVSGAVCFLWAFILSRVNVPVVCCYSADMQRAPISLLRSRRKQKLRGEGPSHQTAPTRHTRAPTIRRSLTGGESARVAHAKWRLALIHVSLFKIKQKQVEKTRCYFCFWFYFEKRLKQQLLSVCFTWLTKAAL